jgi:uncharacterized short protein YbdD (DUF466 family)
VTPSALSTLRVRAQRLGVVIRRIIGAPDYERYLAHVAHRHPSDAPLSREDFARDALARRYDRPGSRCC